MNTHEEYKTQLTAELQTITKELETIATYSEETGDWVAIPEGGGQSEMPMKMLPLTPMKSGPIAGHSCLS